VKFDPIDIVLFAGLVAGAILGYRAGVARKLLNVLALIGSIVLAAYLMKPIGSFFTGVVLVSEPTASILGFAVVVVFVMAGIILIDRKFGSHGIPKAYSQVVGIILECSRLQSSRVCFC